MVPTITPPRNTCRPNSKMWSMPRTRVSFASAGEKGSSSTCCSSGWGRSRPPNPGLHPAATNPVSEAEARQKVLARYKNQLKYWKQRDNYDLMEIYLSDLTTSVDPHSN